jgi:hypothetical protein
MEGREAGRRRVSLPLKRGGRLAARAGWGSGGRPPPRPSPFLGEGAKGVSPLEQQCHARPCAGHPCFRIGKKGVDGRDEPAMTRQGWHCIIPDSHQAVMAGLVPGIHVLALGAEYWRHQAECT